MDELLNENVPEDELAKFEKKFQQEKGEASHTIKFEYAYCLIRSKYSNDVLKGILLLEDLVVKHPEGRRDYIYCLAFGNARIKQYAEGMKYCKAFREIEPYNDQVRMLEEHIKKQSDKDVVKGMAVAGGAALVLGGIVGLGFALAKK